MQLPPELKNWNSCCKVSDTGVLKRQRLTAKQNLRLLKWKTRRSAIKPAGVRWKDWRYSAASGPEQCSIINKTMNSTSLPEMTRKGEFKRSNHDLKLKHSLMIHDAMQCKVLKHTSKSPALPQDENQLRCLSKTSHTVYSIVLQTAVGLSSSSAT